MKVFDKKNCCPNFQHSKHLGTDSTAEGPVILGDKKNGYFLGNDLPKINFCPWCKEFLYS